MLLTFGIGILNFAMSVSGASDSHDTRVCRQARGGTREGDPTMPRKVPETLVFLLVAHAHVM